MTPDQQAGSNPERQDERADAERDEPEGEAGSGREPEKEHAEARGEEGSEGEGERSTREDLKDLPREMREDARRVYRGTDENIAQRMEEKPVFERALDLRIVAASLVIAFVIALVLRLIGLSPLFSILIFFILLAGLWIGLARFYAARRSRSDGASGRESRKSDDDDEGDGEDDG